MDRVRNTPTESVRKTTSRNPTFPQQLGFDGFSSEKVTLSGRILDSLKKYALICWTFRLSYRQGDYGTLINLDLVSDRCGQATSVLIKEDFWMNASIKNYCFKFMVTAIVIMTTSAVINADEPKDKSSIDAGKNRRLSVVSKSQTPADGFQSVEMFSAMESGEIAVVIKTKSASDSNLLVTNNSNRPLSIEMPATFSAVPVLRQGFAGAGGGQMGGMGGGGMGGMGGGGMFNIPPGKTGRLQLKTICLEEGKPDPSLGNEYVIQPLEKLTSDPKIAEMCRMLANDEISQPVAQAAAWHITDKLSWQELLVKNRVELMDGSFERFFDPAHLQLAQQVVVAAVQRADARAKFEQDSQRSTAETRVSTIERKN